MILFYFVASSVTAFAAASTTVIRMNTRSYSFPIEYIVTEGETTISGVGLFDNSAMVDFLNPAPIRLGHDHPDTFLARSILIGENAARIDLDRPLRLYSASTAIIGTGPLSQFAQIVPNFLLAPVSESDTELVLNPSDPNEYAYEGNFLYTPISFTSTSLSIRGGVRLSGHSDPATVFSGPLSISFLEGLYTRIPAPIGSDLIARIHALGIRTTPDIWDSHRIRLYDVTDDHFAALPSLDIIIQGDADGSTEFHIGRLEPIEYLLRGFSDERDFTLWIDDSDDNTFELPRRVVEKLSIHFDYENNRIGFADPLVEL